MHSHSQCELQVGRPPKNMPPSLRPSKLSIRHRTPNRRRAGGGNDTNNKHPTKHRSSLMSSSPSATANVSSSKRLCYHHNDGSGISIEEDIHFTVRDGQFKENVQNESVPFHATSSDGAADCGERRLNQIKTAAVNSQALQNNNSITRTSPSNTKEMGDRSSSTSLLGFIDEMDKSMLMPTVASALGIDLAMYKSQTVLNQCLERSFECKMNDIMESNSETRYSNAVYHAMLGQINPPSVNNIISCPTPRRYVREDNMAYEPSIAFPKCNTRVQHNISLQDCNSKLDIASQYCVHRKRTGHGVSLPFSWYRFPTGCEKRPSSSSLERIPVKNEDCGSLSSSWRDLVMNNEEVVSGLLQSKTKERFLPKSLSTTLPDSKCLSQPLSNASRMYQGKIRIESDRGATIREVYDIDKSKFIIGKLNKGDERYFFEKKILPPPPINLLNESNSEGDDDEYDDDDECVAIVRYKICLNDTDLDLSQKELFVRSRDGNPLVGWISDRGRIANDPYLILREISTPRKRIDH